MPIIERNTVVPISIVRQVSTAQDNQTKIHIPVYQGENRLAEKNIFLGDINLKVPKGLRGKETLDIRYSYDMNGLLEVDVTVLSTGKTANLLIEHSPGALSKEEKEKSLKKMKKLKFHPREQEENMALLAKGERLYEASLGERREYIQQLLGQFDKVLENQNPSEIKKAQARLKEIFDELDNEEWI